MDTRRPLAAAIAGALLALSTVVAGPSGPATQPSNRPASTIEPTLPLVIDLRFEAIERVADRTSALLVVEFSALDEVRDLVVEPALSPGLRPAGMERLPRGAMQCARGERRRFVVPVAVDGPGRQEARFEVIFRDPQGRTFRLGQGATLDPATPAAGRLHLGALEMMAVPIEEVPR